MVNIQELYAIGLVCYLDLSQSYRFFISYSSLIISSCLFLIMILLCMLTFKNVRHIRAMSQQLQRNQIRTMTKKDFQLLRCLFVFDVIFILFNIPAQLSNAYQTASVDLVRTPARKAADDFFNNLSTFIHHIPYCASFCIFMLMSKAFRNELKRMIYKLIGKNTIAIREEEHRQENVVINIDVVSRIVA